MADSKTLTEKRQVLRRLVEAKGGWVNGTDLATAECGGSEGLRRLRELRRDDKYDIRKRKHPDTRRRIYQYRLVTRDEAATWTDALDVHVGMGSGDNEAETIAERREFVSKVQPAETYDYQPEPKVPGPRTARLGRTESGEYITVYDGPMPLPEEPVAEGQEDLGVEVAVQYRYEHLPDKLSMGEQVICYACKGHRRKNRKTGRYKDFTSTNHSPSEPCKRCNGFGIIPA